jgi:hypothetical protein
MARTSERTSTSTVRRIIRQTVRGQIGELPGRYVAPDDCQEELSEHLTQAVETVTSDTGRVP